MKEGNGALLAPSSLLNQIGVYSAAVVEVFRLFAQTPAAGCPIFLNVVTAHGSLDGVSSVT